MSDARKRALYYRCVSSVFPFYFFRDMIHDVSNRTNSMINRLLFITINTGLLTTIFTLTSAICVSITPQLNLPIDLNTLFKLGVMPQNFFWTAFNVVQCPLYVNSVMANLNTRRFIRYGRRTEPSYQLSSMHFNLNQTITNGNEAVSL